MRDSRYSLSDEAANNLPPCDADGCIEKATYSCATGIGQTFLCDEHAKPYVAEPDDVIAELRAENERLTTQCDDLWEMLADTRKEERRMERRAERAEAEVERMRPIVQAVMDYDDHFEQTTDGGCDVKPNADLADLRDDFDRIWKAAERYREADDAK